MTLSMLHHYAALKQLQDANSNTPKVDTKGVIMTPQLNVEPSAYIVPLLHLLIGMVNKAWVCLVFFFDKFVENITKLETEIKDQIQECKSFITDK